MLKEVQARDNLAQCMSEAGLWMAVGPKVQKVEIVSATALDCIRNELSIIQYVYYIYICLYYILIYICLKHDRGRMR